MKLSKLAFALLLPAAQSSAATLIHDYQFQNSLSDSLGGPSLISLGGTVGSGMYSFGAQQGLTLSNALINSADYTIFLTSEFSAVTGYRKLVDFKNLTSDNGLYNLNAALNYYPVVTGTANTLPAGTFANVVITRDAASNTVTGYVNGVQQLQFIDSTSDAVFSSANNIINFFQDDAPTGGRESSDGVVKRIEIFNGALTAAQVGGLPTAGVPPSSVPEPISMGLSGAGLAFCVFLKRRRSQK